VSAAARTLSFMAIRTEALLTAAVSRGTSGDGTPVIAGVGGKRIRVRSWMLSAASPVQVFRKGPSGSGPGLISLPASPPNVTDGGDERDPCLPDCDGGVGLTLNLSGAVAVTGVVNYELVPA